MTVWLKILTTIKKKKNKKINYTFWPWIKKYILNSFWPIITNFNKMLTVQIKLKV